MRNHDSVNSVIVGSIPLDRGLKRHYLSRYRKLCSCNGRQYASDVFKKAKEVCTSYRADPHRLEKVEWYLRELPFQKNGWARKLLRYMDSSPIVTLDFLKLYCGPAEPVITVSQSAHQEHRDLQETSRHPTRTPDFLTRWLMWILDPHVLTSLGPGSPPGLKMPDWVNPGTYEYWSDLDRLSSYWRKWRGILLGFSLFEEKRARELCEALLPYPEVYKDFESLTSSSATLDYDYWVISSWLNRNGLTSPDLMCPLSKESLKFVSSYLTHHPDGFNMVLEQNPDGSYIWWEPKSGLNYLSGQCVGFVHHIPKKGTVKRRPIAVPNRFLQMGLNPFCQAEAILVRRLPQDCTFDQSKFDMKITNRINNPSLYVGSVDLSKATDNLPRSWGFAIVDILLRNRMSPSTLSSYQLFKEIAGGPWENERLRTNWPVGQPLGSLPSFNLLAITHNLVLESLAFAKGLTHSPYCILGDDLLVFNKKLQRSYIRLMQGYGVPLSLHKSYEGNLVQFAGKTFIKGQTPRYTSDHAAITWESLFDYQRATGVRIPWNLLPSRFRKRVGAKCSTILTESDAERVYLLAQSGLVSLFAPLSLLHHQTEEQLAQFYVELYGEEFSENKSTPKPMPSSGITMVSGHPVTFGDYGYAEKDGNLLRYRKVEPPQWYRRKFRPCTTDGLICAAARAIKACT